MAYNLVGKVVGQLTVLEKLDERDYTTGRVQWKCRCICGNYKILVTYVLTNKKKPTISCGKCEWHIRHKESYISWCGMKQRCDDIGCKDYPLYGGRGIKYDIRWFKFVEFYKDMGDPPSDSITGERLTLDRINTNGNYEKGNCKWSTRSEQQLNKQVHYKESNGGLIK